MHHKDQKFSSGTGSPGLSRKKGRKTVVVCVWYVCDVRLIGKLYLSGYLWSCLSGSVIMYIYVYLISAYICVFRMTMTRRFNTTIKRLSLRHQTSFCRSSASDRCIYSVETTRTLVYHAACLHWFVYFCFCVCLSVSLSVCLAVCAYLFVPVSVYVCLLWGEVISDVDVGMVWLLAHPYIVIYAVHLKLL